MIFDLIIPMRVYQKGLCLTALQIYKIFHQLATTCKLNFKIFFRVNVLRFDKRERCPAVSVSFFVEFKTTFFRSTAHNLHVCVEETAHK